MSEPMTELERLEYHDAIKRRHRLAAERVHAREMERRRQHEVDSTITSGLIVFIFTVIVTVAVLHG